VVVLQGKTKSFTIKDCHRNNAVVATLKKGATGFLPCMYGNQTRGTAILTANQHVHALEQSWLPTERCILSVCTTHM
jgi:hypothetical protein